MVSSMTGFGRYESIDPQRKITVELKSVNHKYLDASIKMPRKFNAFEGEIRNILKEYASRGKIDIFITLENLSGGNETLRYDKSLAQQYVDYYRQIKADFQLEGSELSASVIGRCPEVLVLEEEEDNAEELWEALKPVLRGAFAMFRDSREKEGEALKKNILGKLDEMDGHVAYVEERLPQVVAAFRTRMEDRLKEFIQDGRVEEGRIAAEVTIYADKVAVDEELVRLATHISHMRDILKAGGDCGRNLDFLAQEMNRESNTILSKSNDIEITNRGIELKTCIEKIREQVQNIE